MESKEGGKMMELSEPKRKRRVRLQQTQPFPINVGSKEERVMYTGHLSALGVCVIQPDEIQALNSMGYFGKGSLSRSFPNFGIARYRAPPVVRNRQWVRRKEWLEAAKELEAESFLNDSKGDSWEDIGPLDSDQEAESNSSLTEQCKKITGKETENKNEVNENPKENMDDKITSNNEEENSKTVSANGDISGEGDCSPKKKLKRTDNESNETVLHNEKNKENRSSDLSQINSDIIEISEIESESNNFDEVVLDSTEEEDVCEITNKSTDDSSQKSVTTNKEIILLNDEEMQIGSDLETENKDTDTDSNANKVLVLQDSESETEDFLTKIQPRIEDEGFPIRETLHLTFEETFFLTFGLGCLQIVDLDGNILSIKETWNYFCESRSDFVQKYVVYHYFRSKGWVVKPGLKYGGDFLLYKQGPPFYHASYIVIVEVVDADTLIRDDNKTTRKMTWNKLNGLERLSETAAKEILFAQVLWPSSIPRDSSPSTPEVLNEFTVKELLWRRWIPKENREEVYLEDDDDS